MTPNPRSDFLKGLAYAMAGSMLISSNFVIVKFALTQLNSETLVSVWMLAATIYAVLGGLLGGGIKTGRLSPQSLRYLIAIGVMGGISLLVGWTGLKYLDPGFASFLWRFMPALAILMGAVVLHERLLALEVGSVAIMSAGAVFSAVQRWDIVGVGMVLVLIGIIATATQMLLAKVISPQVDSSVIVVFRVSIGAALVVSWTVLTGKLQLTASPLVWLVVIGGAFFGEYLAWFMFYRSYTHWDFSRTSIVRTAEPLLVLPVAFVTLGSFPDTRELIGGFIILAGAILLAFSYLRKVSAGEQTGEQQLVVED